MAHVKLREIAENSAFDPRKAIWDALGQAIFQVHPSANWTIVATYIRPEKTAGGIIRPDSTLQEDRFQGKVGLLVRKGPIAWRDPEGNTFGHTPYDVDDWVIYVPADGREFYLLDSKERGVSCRWMLDQSIKGKVDSPEVIW